MNLTQIFDKNGSDKGNYLQAHGYAAFYEKWIAREKVKVLLEVGIGVGSRYSKERRGSSIRGWREWLPEDALIIGCDINMPDPVTAKLPNFIFVHLDQGDPISLGGLAKFLALKDLMPDVIIDDGSHLSHHQVLTLEKLWPSLRPGGIYVIEDTYDQGNPPHPRHGLPKEYPVVETMPSRDGKEIHGLILQKP